MLSHVWAWVNDDVEDKRLDMWLGIATGVILFMVVRTLLKQTALLEDMYTMAHEQRRMWLAKAQRDMAAAAAKESDSNA